MALSLFALEQWENPSAGCAEKANEYLRFSDTPQDIVMIPRSCRLKKVLKNYPAPYRESIYHAAS